MHRRSFVVKSAAAAFGFQILPSGVLRAAVSPNSRIRLAAIGCGGQGAADLNGMTSEEIVALCDVDERSLGPAAAKHAQARTFRDFRRMFDGMADGIDAVLVATPDHTHFPAVMAALEAGKHVYCEKPLAHSIAQVRAMRKAALERKVVTQVGNQGHSSHSIRTFREMVESGVIGEVTEVHAGCDAFPEVYCQIGRRAALETERPPVPKELDWDLWLGPAAERPYHPAYAPFGWRGFSAFGSGCIGDWVCHVLDPVFWTLDLDMPTAITAEVTGYDPARDGEFYPKGSRITYEFPARGSRGPVKVIWHDGETRIPKPPDLGPDASVIGTGAVITGTKGRIMHGSHGAASPHIITESLRKDFRRPDEKYPRVPRGDHQADWLNAIRENRQAGSPFEYGGALSEIGLLGLIAIRRAGTRLLWDAGAMRFTNDDEANALLNPPARSGWPAPA